MWSCWTNAFAGATVFGVTGLTTQLNPAILHATQLRHTPRAITSSYSVQINFVIRRIPQFRHAPYTSNFVILRVGGVSSARMRFSAEINIPPLTRRCRATGLPPSRERRIVEMLGLQLRRSDAVEISSRPASTPHQSGAYPSASATQYSTEYPIPQSSCTDAPRQNWNSVSNCAHGLGVGNLLHQ